VKPGNLKVSVFMLVLLILWLPSRSFGEIATRNEARTVAENWIRLIVERDGSWAGSKEPKIRELTGLKSGDLEVAYFALIDPEGFIVISLLKDFAPILAYSTGGGLGPDSNNGIVAHIKSVSEKRMNLFLKRAGGMQGEKPNKYGEKTRRENKELWDQLLEGGASLRTNLQALRATSLGRKGPLLETNWHQGPPFNNHSDNEGCSWFNEDDYNQNVPLGCGPLAMAQVMKFFNWPVYRNGGHIFDWPNMQKSYTWNHSLGQFVDQNSHTVTPEQIKAVDTLCGDAYDSLNILWENCEWTAAIACNYAYWGDMRGALEGDFFYSDQDCAQRSDYTVEDWWTIIAQEIKTNRPVIYEIKATWFWDFDHYIVVDGYDDTLGHYQVHANYGWSDPKVTTWYTLDGQGFYCNDVDCDPSEDAILFGIYPKDGLCGYSTGVLTERPWFAMHDYFYCDVFSDNLRIEPGAVVQFLGGGIAKLTCSGNQIQVNSTTEKPVLFFSRGDRSQGIKATGGQMALNPGGTINMLH
jgi:hypothetical protein